MRRLIQRFLVFFAILAPFTALGQTDSDGAMRIYHYTDNFYTDNNDEWGTDEHTWYYYRREEGDLIGCNNCWDQELCYARNCGGGCYGYPGWGFDRTYNQATVPTQFRMRGRYWEDDRGSRCSFDDPWYGNSDDDYNNWEQQYNVRQGCPYVWTYYGWLGSYWRNVHYSRTYYTSPRPDYARVNGVSGTYNQCGPGWITLQSAGRQCTTSRYYWYRNGTYIGNTTSGSFSYYNTGAATFTVYTNDQGANSYWSQTVTVNFSNPPTANAGTNISQCWSGGAFNVTTGASATNYSSVSWQIVAGSGATLSNTTSLTGCTLTPSVNNGSVTVRLTTSSPGCPNATSQKTVSWNRAPFGSEGTPDPTNICFSPNLGTIQMTNASKGGYSTTATWSVQSGSGSGSWSQNTSNPSLAVFTPTSNTGSRTMRMRVQATAGACNGQTADYFRTVNWSRLDAYAGTPVSQCNTNNVTTTAASITGSYSSFSWSWIPQTGNAGSVVLNNNTSLTGCFISNLTGAGSGILRLTVVGVSPCGTITRDKFVEWSSSPAANAGGTLNVCSGSGTAIPMTGATGGGSTGNPTWTGGSGLGTWTNGGSNPAAWTFTPNGSNPSGSFTATLTVVGVAPCSGTVTSTRTVSWSTPPTANAGGTLNSCSGSSAITMTGASAGGTYGSVSWTIVSGGGSFTGSGTNPASYSYNPPSSSGSAIVRLTVNGNGANCTGESDTDTRVINWDSMSASSPATVNSCGTGVISMATSTATGAFSSLAWSGQSGGSWTLTNSTDPNWQFTPSASSGNFTATLTLTGSGACTGQTATSTTVVDWDETPAVNAGTDVLVCSGSGTPISMSTGSPSASGQISSITWTTSSTVYGSGSWSGSGSNPSTWTFTPTTDQGYIIAQLQASGSANCSGQNPTDTRVIQWSANPAISSVSVTDQTDCNAPNGTIVVVATGQGPLSYSSDNGATFAPTDTILGIALGTYNVVVQDSVGCSTTYGSNPVSVGGPSPVTAGSVVVTSNNLCAGGISGVITITNPSGGGGGPFEYGLEGPGGSRWFDITANPMAIDSLAADDYQVVVRDQFGCMSVVYNRTVSEPNAITISSLNITNVVGCGSSGTGAISINASGGTGTLTYWLDSIQNSPATSGTWTGLPAGGYEVMVSDDNACNTLASAQINAPWTITAGNNVYECGGGATTLQGEIIGVLPNDCTPTCTSGCGMPSGYCSATGTNLSDDWISFVGFNTIANGSGSTGYSNFTNLSTTIQRGSTYTLSVTVSKNSGWNQYVRAYFDWNRDGDFNDAGEVYNLGNSSANPQNTSLSITVPAGASLGTTRMRIYETYAQYPSANGCGTLTYSEVEDYSIEVIGSFVACNPTYSWSPSGGSSLAATVSPSATTTYTLTVNDGDGCIQSDDVVVNVSNQTTSTTEVDVDCYGNDNGCIVVNASNGIQPYLLYGPSNTVQVYNGNMRPVTVNNTSGTAYTNHPVKMTVPYSAGMRADFADIRFYDSNQNMLSYWIEEVNLSTSAVVWVKLVTMPTGNSTVYMTFGNTSLRSASNGDDVFEFFDDFNSFSAADWTSGTISGTALGTDWSYYGGSLLGGNIRRYYQSNATFTGARILETKAYQVTVNCNGYTPLGIWGSTTNGASFLPHRCSNRMYVRDDGGWVSYGNNHPSYRLNEWLRYEIHHNNANANFRIYRENGTQVLNTNLANSAITSERVRIGSRHDNWNGSSETGHNFNVQWDWMFVRPYIAVEPTVSFGTVQTSDNEFCDLTPGTYNVTIMDVAGCSDTETAVIEEPSGPLSISSIAVTNTWCYTEGYGELDITVTGGTPAYIYSWAGPSSYTSSSEDLTGLNSGVYNVTVADDNACTVTSSATVGTLTPINGAPSFTWKGVTDQLWQDPTNWDCGLPDATSPVIIPAVPVGGNTPLIQNGIIGDVLNIDIQGSTTDLLEIQTGGLLRIHQ